MLEFGYAGQVAAKACGVYYDVELTVVAVAFVFTFAEDVNVFTHVGGLVGDYGVHVAGEFYVATVGAEKE